MDQPNFDFEAGDSSSPVQWELSFDSALAPPKPRNAERFSLALHAALRQRGAAAVTVGILDLSTHGFRMDTHLNMPVGTAIWLRLPGLEAVPAKVAWVQGHCAGCAFERPLHPAVLDLIVKRSGGPTASH
ncbi:MAG: PilZ domain-containing protein [Sphingomonas sp.]